jgi:hypothetical protein
MVTAPPVKPAANWRSTPRSQKRLAADVGAFEDQGAIRLSLAGVCRDPTQNAVALGLKDGEVLFVRVGCGQGIFGGESSSASSLSLNLMRRPW